MSADDYYDDQEACELSHVESLEIELKKLEVQLKEAEGIIVWSKKSTIEPSYKVMSLINEYLAKYKVVENE